VEGVLGRNQVQSSESFAVAELVGIVTESNLVFHPLFFLISDISACSLNPSIELAIGINISIGFVSNGA
jgi:hypothetical protein